MYFVTAATFDSLTLNTPYPVRHANSGSPFLRTHRDEFVFTIRATSAGEWTGRMQQHMDMVDSGNQRRSMHLADDASEIGEQIGAKIRLDQWTSTLRRKD